MHLADKAPIIHPSSIMPHLPRRNHWLFEFYGHTVAWQMRLKITQLGTILRLETMAASLTEHQENENILIECTRTGVPYPSSLLRWPSIRYIAFEAWHSVFPNQILHGTMQPLQLQRHRWKAPTCILEPFDCIRKVM